MYVISKTTIRQLLTVGIAGRGKLIGFKRKNDQSEGKASSTYCYSPPDRYLIERLGLVSNYEREVTE